MPRSLCTRSGVGGWAVPCADVRVKQFGRFHMGGFHTSGCLFSYAGVPALLACSQADGNLATAILLDIRVIGQNQPCSLTWEPTKHNA